MKRLLAILLLVTLVDATDSPTGIWAPTTTLPVSNLSAAGFPLTANKLRCLDWIPTLGLVNGTEISWIAVGAWTATVGVALYIPATGAKVWGTSSVVASPTTVTATGLTPFTITPGVLYRLCWCASSTSASYQGAWISGQTAGTLGAVQSILNTFSVHSGLASTDCSPAGVTPGNPGSLSAEAGTPHDALAVWMSKE